MASQTSCRKNMALFQVHFHLAGQDRRLTSTTTSAGFHSAHSAQLAAHAAEIATQAATIAKLTAQACTFALTATRKLPKDGM
jgi:acid phosphatase family membrane protein YuiD